jgi:hypothetical protein
MHSCVLHMAEELVTVLLCTRCYPRLAALLIRLQRALVQALSITHVHVAAVDLSVTAQCHMYSSVR